jgi:dipeptidyl aminopeptidase/acylaminoacyl peptidase
MKMDMTERYQAAERLLTQHTRHAVLNGRPSITWVDGIRLFYERQFKEDGEVRNETVWLDGVTGEKCECKPEPAQADSAGGRYDLFYRNHNLVLLDRETQEETMLTGDGSEYCEYGPYVDIYSQVTVKRQGYVERPLVLWSPDGRYFVTYRADRRFCGKLSVIKSFMDETDQLRPKVYEYPCPFVTDPDDEIPHYMLYVGDAQKKKLYPVDAPDFLYPVFTSPEKSWVRWLDDSTGFYFTWLKRGYQEGRMYLADPSDGSTRLLITEKTDTFLNLGAFGLLDGYGSYAFSNFVTADRKYAFWQSERSGFAHLYRYDLADGSVLDIIGAMHWELIVQKIIRVDETAKKIYFMANNVPECSDPLYYQLYVVDFDGEGLTRLTPEDGVHAVSMGEQSFVDTWSRIDLPPVTVLRRLDGTLIRELERADISELLALGYQMPERFTVTAADGETKLYGILVRPVEKLMTENRDQLFPVIDYIYGAAQLYNVPREFTWDNGMDREIMGGLQEFAQLGFAGIILDGRGTPGRGKAFHDYSFRRFEWCDGLVDHVACATELKEKYPFLDMDRVGMWGNSGGGYGTATALLTYPEFYKVGVAASGNYDQRMYEHSWTERYGGLYDPEVYEAADVTRLAGNLQGKLMLAYGALDDNVTMSQTIRLCDALNLKNKDYDLMVLPRKNHNVPSDLYFMRRKMDYFVKYLMREEPPKEFRL